LVIAGTSSGVGKTSLALGLAAAMVRRGLRVQTFKVGPDFLDPTYLALASGRPCYNLDGWMTGREYVRQLPARTTADADVAVIEGVMGMFDGASPDSLEGSTAEIALWLDAPVLLVTNAHGSARSLAAAVKGFNEFERGVRVAGVIANQSGSDRHKAWLAEALAAAGLPPLAGTVPRGSLPSLPSRHLGLVTADDRVLPRETIEQLGQACAKHLDIDLILRLARSASAITTPAPAAQAPLRNRVRLGIARDEAFHFYYPDNLEALEACGAELVPFSPLADRALPQGLDAIYFGGGYPEVHAEQLAANEEMTEAVRRFAAEGRPVYAECGGLMYLGRSLRTLDGKRLPLAGVLPIDTAMLGSLKSLGYVEATTPGDSIWGGAGRTIRGHEFHYSEITADDSAAEGWRPAYSVRRRRTDGPAAEGFQKGRVLASYVHLHWASRPEAAAAFVHGCKGAT
jgi:cobyrinic acid a,c-diamide synthase